MEEDKVVEREQGSKGEGKEQMFEFSGSSS